MRPLHTSGLASILVLGVVPAALSATPAVARADGVYLTEALGGGAVRDQLGDRVNDRTFRFRAGAGYRAGTLAFEAWIAPEFGATGGIATPSSTPYQGDTYSGVGPTLVSYGLDIKRMFPIDRHVSLYVRGSMSRMQIAPGEPSLGGYAGRGLGGGVGAQVSGKVSALGLLAWPLFFVDQGPKIDAGVFLEEGYDFYRLHRAGSASIDAQITRWTLGVAVGSDF